MQRIEPLVNNCPGCGHDARQHVGGTCYVCAETPPLDVTYFGGKPTLLIHGCGLVILGEGNAWGVEPGWHRGDDLDAISDVQEFLGYRVPHVRYAKRNPPK